MTNVKFSHKNIIKIKCIKQKCTLPLHYINSCVFASNYIKINNIIFMFVCSREKRGCVYHPDHLMNSHYLIMTYIIFLTNHVNSN